MFVSTSRTRYPVLALWGASRNLVQDPSEKKKGERRKRKKIERRKKEDVRRRRKEIDGETC